MLCFFTLGRFINFLQIATCTGVKPAADRFAPGIPGTSTIGESLVGLRVTGPSIHFMKNDFFFFYCQVNLWLKMKKNDMELKRSFFR